MTIARRAALAFAIVSRRAADDLGESLRVGVPETEGAGPVDALSVRGCTGRVDDDTEDFGVELAGKVGEIFLVIVSTLRFGSSAKRGGGRVNKLDIGALCLVDFGA